MIIIASVGEGVHLLRKYERVGFSEANTAVNKSLLRSLSILTSREG